MLKYIRGEIYRLLHKKSMYLFFAALAVGYLFVIYIRSGGFTEQSIVDEAITFFFFLPAVVGGYFFSAVYTDDLNSKNLISLVGFGIGKVKIVVSKFILVTLFNAVVFALIPLFHFAVFRLLGWSAATDTWYMVYALSLKYLLMTTAFSVLSGIVVYGLQRATFAVVTYILLAFNIVSGLLATALKAFAPSLTGVLISGITDNMMAGVINSKSLMMPIVEYVIYVGLAMALSMIAFTKKEMEF